TPTMKTDIQLCVCFALVAVCIAGVRSAGSYGENLLEEVFMDVLYHTEVDTAADTAEVDTTEDTGEVDTASRGRFLVLPLLLPGTLLRRWKTREGGNVRVTPVIIARTGGRRRGGGLLGGGGSGFEGIFSLITGNISGGSNHGNDILEPHKGQSLGTHTVILMN
ncbi:Hypothetical predicted protein, partial [Mytilus galloprovincialis]